MTSLKRRHSVTLRVNFVTLFSWVVVVVVVVLCNSISLFLLKIRTFHSSQLIMTFSVSRPAFSVHALNTSICLVVINNYLVMTY